jgi:hypothetical protein
MSCAFACNGTTNLCEQCDPGTPTMCSGNNMAVHCSSAGVQTTASCNLGCNAMSGDCNQCVPSTNFCSTDGTTSTACKANGTPGTMTSCAYGCQADSTKADAGKCKEIAPSNGLTLSCLTPAPAAGGLDVLADATIDPSAGTITGSGGITIPTGSFSTHAQTSGPTIGVFHLTHLTIAAGKTLTVQGGAAKNAIAFVVDGDVTIDGTLDASAALATPGPGASTTQVGGMGTGAGATKAGSGGGGFATAGGAGGGSTGTPAATGGIAGAAFGMPTLIPLQGGGSGGSPAGIQAGAGGGAVQITACGSIHVTGMIKATGGGGYGGTTGGGAGAGAGGGILLEAASVTVTGTLATNGGGGGGGGGGTPTTGGNSGGDGTTTTTPALGGTGGGTPKAGTGGAGAAGATAALDGAPSATNGGGGGGGAGRVRLNGVQFTATGTPAVTTTSGIITPATSTVGALGTQ